MKDRVFHWFRMAHSGAIWHLVETGEIVSECGDIDYFGPVYSVQKYPNDSNDVCKECIGHNTLAGLAE